MDKAECIEVMRIAHAERANTTISTRPYEAWKVDEEQGWNKQAYGAAALIGCASIWLAGSWLESM